MDDTCRVLIDGRKCIEVHFGESPPVLWPKPGQEIAVLSSGSLKFAMRLTGQEGIGVTLRHVLKVAGGAECLIDCRLPSSVSERIDSFDLWRTSTWFKCEQEIRDATDGALVSCAVLQLLGTAVSRGVIRQYEPKCRPRPFKVVYEVCVGWESVSPV
jgi:hypothetical protein